MHVIERSGRAAETVALQLQRMTDTMTSTLVLGALVKGGAPTAVDRHLGLAYGAGAVRALSENQRGVMVAFEPPDLKFVPLAEAINRVRTVPASSIFVQTARSLGIVLNIQHFSTHDGPGIRTTMFLKGCWRKEIGVGIGIGIGVEGDDMGFGHEKLDVHRAPIEYVGLAYRYCETLKGHRNAKDQLLRASQAIPLNIAEGNANAKALLDRIVAMLTTLGQRGYVVHETPNDHGVDRIDTDSDSDPDTDGGKEPRNRQQADS